MVLKKEEFFKKRIIITVIGVITALAWHEAMMTLFETFSPKQSELIGKFVYAIILLFIVLWIYLPLKKN